MLTAAHVLKGADEIVVSDAERTTTGTIIGFDPQMDLALVRLADPLGDVVPLAGLDDVAEADVEGADGVAYVMRDGAIVEIPVMVQRKINLRTEDIYIDGEYDRPGMGARRRDEGRRLGRRGGGRRPRHRRALAAQQPLRITRAYAIDPVRAGATIRAQFALGRPRRASTSPAADAGRLDRTASPEAGELLAVAGGVLAEAGEGLVVEDVDDVEHGLGAGGAQGDVELGAAPRQVGGEHEHPLAETAQRMGATRACATPRRPT